MTRILSTRLLFAVALVAGTASAQVVNYTTSGFFTSAFKPVSAVACAGSSAISAADGTAFKICTSAEPAGPFT